VSVRGIWSAVLTPIDDAMQPDARKAIVYYRELLASGIQGLNVLGTTGEAMSFSVEQRMAFMSALAASGLPRERMMAGSGAASLDDAVRLVRHAFECGFSAALVMPPFYFRDASDDGIVAFFDALFARAAPPARGVLLYNFPRMTGITFHPDLVDRLLTAFPGVIVGMKESSNDPRLQSELIARHANFTILVGSEANLLAAKQRGAAGCISGSVALWPHLAHDVFEDDDRALEEELTLQRAALSAVPFVSAVRYLTARMRSDDGWERPMPPLVPLTPQQKVALARAMEANTRLADRFRPSSIPSR
jgi:4-hydroxy-tetrahydrodipicolinate synthase